MRHFGCHYNLPYENSDIFAASVFCIYGLVPGVPCSLFRRSSIKVSVIGGLLSWRFFGFSFCLVFLFVCFVMVFVLIQVLLVFIFLIKYTGKLNLDEGIWKSLRKLWDN